MLNNQAIPIRRGIILSLDTRPLQLPAFVIETERGIDVHWEVACHLTRHGENTEHPASSRGAL